MPSFSKGAIARTPFGKNQAYLRTTVGNLFESYTLAASSLRPVTIDGVANEKSIQSGTFMAKITSGPEAGKIGPYEPAGTAAVQTLTVTGTGTAGTFTLTVPLPSPVAATGATTVTTAPIAYNANAATVNAALVTALTGTGGVITAAAAGVVLTGAASTFTFGGSYNGPQALITVDFSLATGVTAATCATTTAGVAGSLDGRGTSANIIGVLDTFVPWQLMERDVEVAVLYRGACVAANCIVYAAGQASTITPGTTEQGYVRSVAGMDILFH